MRQAPTIEAQAAAFRQAQKQIAAFSALQAREVYFQPDYPVQRMLQHMDEGHAGRVLLSLNKNERVTLAQNPAQAQAFTPALPVARITQAAQGEIAEHQWQGQIQE